MKTFLLIVLALVSLPAQAYVGPGMGAGTIVSVLGVLGAILLAILGVLYYPIKRMLKKRKKAKQTNAPS